jgi:hypothetical protein
MLNILFDKYHVSQFSDIENIYEITGFNLNSVLVGISSDKLIYNKLKRDIGKNLKSVQSRASRRGNTCASIRLLIRLSFFG